MGGEAEFVEEGIQEAAPFIVIGLGEPKNDGHVRLDVDGLKNDSRRRRGGGGAGEGDAAVGGGGGRDVGDIGVKERVDVHISGSWWAAEEGGGPRKRAR